MSVAQDIADRLALIAAQLPQVTTTYAQAPRTIADADLPAVIVLPSRATHTRNGDGQLETTRTYTLMLLVANAKYGTEAEYTSNVLDVVEALVTHLAQRVGLESGGLGDSIAHDALVSADEGLQVISYPATETQQYLGTVISVTVVYIQTFAYVS